MLLVRSSFFYYAFLAIIHTSRFHERNVRMRKHLQQSLTARLITTISAIVLTICVVFLFLIEHHVETTITKEMGDKALSSAYLIAERPDIIDAFSHDEPSRYLQPIAEELRAQISASFIVIGNADGIRYTHPDEQKIGQLMVGGDNDAALVNNEAIVSTTTGSLGESMRGKVPVVSDGHVIGIVSVGFLTKDIEQTIAAAFHEWLQITLALALFGVICAALLSYYVKRQLLGMQPTQIAKLYTSYFTILDETTDGIILTNAQNEVVLSNARAQQLLPSLENGLALANVLPAALVAPRHIRALQLPLQQQSIIMSKTPLETELGYLYILRRKDEYETVVSELSRIKQQAQMQRAKTHEFSNKLHIILGLLKQRHVAGAIAFIQQEQLDETSTQQALAAQPSVLIAALLEGKIAEAAEKNITLKVESNDVLHAYNDQQIDALLTAFGNVLQNAIEALHTLSITDKQIDVLMHEYAHELLIEVHDNGQGIAEDVVANIFTLGFSTKDGFERGYGLAISQQALVAVGGAMFVEDSDLGGACFIISLRKETER